MTAGKISINGCVKKDRKLCVHTHIRTHTQWGNENDERDFSYCNARIQFQLSLIIAESTFSHFSLSAGWCGCVCIYTLSFCFTV